MTGQFATFLIASFVLAITPGPAVVYIVTQTLSGGRMAGLASIAGIALGNLGNAAFASVGLAAVFAASTLAFTVVKLLGAAYLVFLGIRSLRAGAATPLQAPASPRSAVRRFREGLTVALLNPKTALFFAALLPQFIQPGGHPLSQSLALGCVFVSIALCTDSLYVCAAAALAANAGKTRSLSTYGRFVSAASFIGLGLYAAFAGAPSRHAG